MAQKKQQNFSEAMQKLHEINDWFEQEDLDLEQALGKLKEGKELISLCKSRLQEIENEFVELKADMEDVIETKETAQNVQGVTQEDEDLPF